MGYRLDERGLTVKQAAFVREYMVDFNGTQAAIRSGYSRKAASTSAAENMQKPAVQKAIEEEKAKAAQRTEISVDRLLLEYARVAYQDPRNYYNEDGSLKPITELDDDAAAAVAGMDTLETFQGDDDEPTRRVLKKIKMWSKDKSMDALGRYLGIFEKHNAQQQVNIFPPDIVKSEDSGQ